MSLHAKSGETDAIVIIKAAPQATAKHGETVCCAGVDLQGQWLRLYPIAFRTLEEGQKFGRWDRVRFRWRRPTDDQRLESRRVDQHSLEIVGSLRQPEREKFLAALVVTGLDAERSAGRSLALLKAETLAFYVEPRSAEELGAEAAKFSGLRNQLDLFNTKSVVPYQPCPYRFKYRYGLTMDCATARAKTGRWRLRTFTGPSATERRKRSRRCVGCSAKSILGKGCCSQWGRTLCTQILG